MKTKELKADFVTRAALEDGGFELAGIAPAGPVEDFGRYMAWVQRGSAGKMGYLTDRRAGLRESPRELLPSARSVLCVGKLYNGPEADVGSIDAGQGWISRYAWGEDYHGVLRKGLERVVQSLQAEGVNFEYKICVDTAPLLERSLARAAGLGWIGKNTCLINEPQGSWFFLGEILLSLDLAPGAPPPDRCGSCTRCIEACPTDALVPFDNGWTLDAKRCISYLTIELRGEMPEEVREKLGSHIFGCDICQDVCPWNRRAPTSLDDAFSPRNFAPGLCELAALTADEFRKRYGDSPVLRAKHSGFLRNVATALGNSCEPGSAEALRRLAAHPDPAVATHARWALERAGV